MLPGESNQRLVFAGLFNTLPRAAIFSSWPLFFLPGTVFVKDKNLAWCEPSLQGKRNFQEKVVDHQKEHSSRDGVFKENIFDS
jgi:hypothetical protein